MKGCRMTIEESMVGNLGLRVILIWVILNGRRNVLNEHRCALFYLNGYHLHLDVLEKMLELSINDQE